MAKLRRVRAGRGRKPSISAAKIEEIVRLTMHETPPGNAMELPVECQAGRGQSGHGAAVLSGRGLTPHLVKSFKLSNDPRFEEKLIDVVGLYVNPPDKAVVDAIGRHWRHQTDGALLAGRNP